MSMVQRNARQQMLSFSKPSEYDDLEDMTAKAYFRRAGGALRFYRWIIDVIVENPGAAPTCPKGCGRQ